MEIERRVAMRPTAVDLRAAVVEFCLTTAFMATVFSLVRWTIGTMPSSASVNDLRVRVAALSLVVGVIIVGFAVSRAGRFSGAHMNPAITVGLYAAGSLPARRVLPYLTAQTAGSIAAAGLTRALWGSSVSERPVRWAVVQPGPGWNGASVTVAEAATLMVIVGTMCWLAASRSTWHTAWVVGGLFGLQGALLGTLTGGSANPARQLGPALFSGELRLLAAYVGAPMAGALFAGWFARGFGMWRAAAARGRLRPATSAVLATGNSPDPGLSARFRRSPSAGPKVPSAASCGPGSGVGVNLRS